MRMSLALIRNTSAEYFVFYNKKQQFKEVISDMSGSYFYAHSLRFRQPESEGRGLVEGGGVSERLIGVQFLP